VPSSILLAVRSGYPVASKSIFPASIGKKVVIVSFLLKGRVSDRLLQVGAL
jgi:hypothetical protein